MGIGAPLIVLGAWLGVRVGDVGAWAWGITPWVFFEFFVLGGRYPTKNFSEIFQNILTRGKSGDIMEETE